MTELSTKFSDLENKELEKIILLLENNSPPTVDETRQRKEAYLNHLSESMFTAGKTTHGEVSGAHPVLNQSEDDFRSDLKNTKQDLAMNCEILTESFALYAKFNLSVPPYYAHRVAIMLSKRKESELEYRFLSAWNKHFGKNVNGKRYSDLRERYEKLVLKLGY